jgi:hypothetical protein
MKVLDIIVEGAAGETAEYVWKFFAKSAAKDAFARETVERIATIILNKYTKKGLTPPRAELDELLDRAVRNSTWKDDIKFITELEKETIRYHNAKYKQWLKQGSAEGSPVGEKVSGATKAKIKEWRAAWAQTTTKQLINSGMWMYASYDIYKSVEFYRGNIDEALRLLEIGPDGKDTDGSPGISLKDFELYHKEQLGQLFINISTVHPALFTKIPIFGWLAKPFRWMGTSGTALWMYFTNMPGTMPFTVPGQPEDMNLRQAIAKLALIQMKDIRWLPGGSEQSVSSVIGGGIKWALDGLKALWTSTVTEFYKGKEVPEVLLPTLLPDDTSSTGKKTAANDTEKKSDGQGGKVVNPTPADADQNANTGTSSAKPPYTKGQPYYHASDWEDIGGGYERHKFNGTVVRKMSDEAKKATAGNSSEDEWNDLGGGNMVNRKTGEVRAKH